MSAYGVTLSSFLPLMLFLLLATVFNYNEASTSIARVSAFFYFSHETCFKFVDLSLFVVDFVLIVKWVFCGLGVLILFLI